MKDKPAIAIIMPGGIGTGKDNFGVPVLENIVKLLAPRFSITVFQLYKSNADYVSEGFELIDIHSSSAFIRIVKFFWVFTKKQRVNKFQVLHGFWALPSGFLAVLAGKLFRIKSIVSLLGGDTVSLPEIHYGQLQTRMGRKFVLWTLHHTDVLMAPSTHAIRTLKPFGLKARSVAYIPMGVDPALFTFREKPVGSPVRFISVGTLSPVKDHVTLLKAFRILKDQIPCQLHIIGMGGLQAELVALASAWGLEDHIFFLGQDSNMRIVGHYHESDILIHTSLSEGHPMVVQEAMSCGVLVCATQVGLVSELTDCCVVVPVRNPEVLAEEILRLLADHVRMKSMRVMARHWVEKHPLSWTIEKIAQLYTSSRHG